MAWLLLTGFASGQNSPVPVNPATVLHQWSQWARPRAPYYEVQHVYQPLQFVRESDGRIRIINRDSFTNPDEYV